MKVSSILTALSAVILGFFIGISFPVQITPKQLQYGLLPCGGSKSNLSSSTNISSVFLNFWAPFIGNSTSVTVQPNNGTSSSSGNGTDVAAVRKPRGVAERLPPGIIVRESDLHLRRLWGNPTSDDATGKYLLTLPVGYTEKAYVNETVHKFSDKFDIVLFHYDGRINEWDEFEWSKRVVHVSARKQAKWWFAKRFLQPSIVAAYEYVFLWDEDLGVDSFTAEDYVGIVRKHGLEISQPALDKTRGRRPQYEVTGRRPGGEIHKSRFVEVMAPVFSRDAWACVWHMIQNDLVHGWGLDYNFWRCVDGNGERDASSAKVRSRQHDEMRSFNARITNADKQANNAATADHHT
ncbi:hypothetical protein GUJ93_ZPchr0006g44077 [Zizania palustris]|uniref:Storage protein n=1 Tax=Zizania palustris TaxID=103762 RepID=A0A8J5SRN2_ZIZPA|nr:hypothetical protein GUJ93_ZPchr0006g44077 [Zizania palustris]